MLTKGTILFVFEGKSTEDIIVSSLERHFFGKYDTIKCVFDAEIYQLYQKLSKSDFSEDLVELLRKRSPENEQILKDYNRDSFAYTYLFFDYDGHSSLANDQDLMEMLQFFNEETEQGKLFISYPMIEAIKHYKDIETFKSLVVKCKRKNCQSKDICKTREECFKEPHYKTFVPTDNDPHMNNLNSYDQKVWKTLITANLCKMNDLVADTFSLPNIVHPQSEVFAKQIEKHISNDCPKVAVLSAFPMFVLDFYGCEKTKAKLQEID
jgi:hypothetical protein